MLQNLKNHETYWSFKKIKSSQPNKYLTKWDLSPLKVIQSTRAAAAQPVVRQSSCQMPLFGSENGFFFDFPNYVWINRCKTRLMTLIDEKHSKDLNAIRFSCILSIFWVLFEKTLARAPEALTGTSTHMKIIGTW